MHSIQRFCLLVFLVSYLCCVDAFTTPSRLQPPVARKGNAISRYPQQRVEYSAGTVNYMTLQEVQDGGKVN